MMLGGHAAEEIVFGEMSTGASDDISKVTKTARAMVTRFGMSERLGPRTFGHKEELVFLGREISEQRDYSEKIAEEIDDEVRRIIDHAHELARTDPAREPRQARPPGPHADGSRDAGRRRRCWR